MSTILMIIPPERFRDEELFVTQAELEKAGHTTVIASTRRGTCPGSRGGFANSALTLDEVNLDDYAAVVFVGGGGSKLLFTNERAKEIARYTHAKGRVTAAICLAPVILANAGVLQGRRATVAGTEAAAIESHGAVYTGPGVIVDGNIITANAPKASQLFGQKINEALSGLA